MPLSPPRRRPALTAGNPSLANADQNLTGVDTRLTKVDTVNPRPNPQPQQNTAQSQPRPPSRHLSVNSRCQPLQHTPNKPEQP